MIHIGIDPGISGALAAIDDKAQLVICADLPVIRDGKLAWIDANDCVEARNGPRFEHVGIAR